MTTPDEDAPALLHNIGGGPRASIVWRGFGRGPIADGAERIEAARGRGSWLHLSLSIGRDDPRFQRDWNTAAALLRIVEPGSTLGEASATRRLTELIEEHCHRLAWPPCLLTGNPEQTGSGTVTLDHAPTTFVALAKCTGNLWLRDRPARLAPLHAPALAEQWSPSTSGVRWDLCLWFAGGIPCDLLDLALDKAGARRRDKPTQGR